MKKITTLISIFLCSITFSIQAQSDVKGFYNRGIERLNNGNYEGAQKEFESALKIDPKHINSLMQHAFCSIQLEKVNEAIADYTKILEIDPKNKVALMSRGSAKDKIKDFKSALTDFDNALAIDPEYQEAYVNRGFAKKGLGDDDGACKDWNKARKLGNDEAKIILKNNRCK